MFRWIFASLLLSACGIAAVWMLAPYITAQPVTPNDAGDKQQVEPRPRPQQAQRPVALAMGSSSRGQLEVLLYHNNNPQESNEPIIIADGNLVIVEKEVVPSGKEGVIKVLGTPVQEGEVVPPEQRLPDIQLGFLAIEVGPNDKPREGETFFQFPNDRRTYRRVRDTDQLEPQKVVLAQETLKMRKLNVGDRVQRGQLLALIDSRRQLDDVRMKIAKLDGLEYERAAAEKQEEEFYRRYRNQLEINRRQRDTIPLDTLMETQLAALKHGFDKQVKAAEILQAQRAVSAAMTDLKMHEIRAAIDGVIKVPYKHHQGEAVKANEPVLEIQNPSRLRVEGRVEVQEAIPKLKPGMTAFVEATRPEAPLRVISGHLNTVNCVAVSKGERPIIVSGSEDDTLRGWDSLTGEKVWMLKGLRSAVRSVACTPPTSKRNLACFGCADGSVRLLDLDNLKDKKPREMSERHRGPVLGVAFSPDGEVCATCGDDHLIRLWKTETGAVLHTLAKHTGPVTSVQFAEATRLVSAARDNRLIVWDVETGKPPHLVASFDGRGGEVLTLGVSPDGEKVLFDQGKELRVLTLDDQQIVGTLRNPSDAGNFSTMAVFSPDGKTILTNASSSDKKLQLWRAPVTQRRGSELRQFIWNGTATCGAFSPDGKFAVTGTQDHKVLVWAMPSKEEIETPLEARLTLVEKDLDTHSRHVRVWAELDAPEWLIPGMRATLVVLPPRK